MATKKRILNSPLQGFLNSLRVKYNFKEKYYDIVDTENNIIYIKTSFPIKDVTFIPLLDKDDIIKDEVCDGLLAPIKLYDPKIESITINITSTYIHINLIRFTNGYEPFGDLPSELLIQILIRNSKKEIHAAECLSKSYHSLINSDTFWINKYNYTHKCIFPQISIKNINYKQFYLLSINSFQLIDNLLLDLSGSKVKCDMYVKLFVELKLYSLNSIMVCINQMLKVYNQRINKYSFIVDIDLLEAIYNNYSSTDRLRKFITEYTKISKIEVEPLIMNINIL
jgi:hypothetical protein